MSEKNDKIIRQAKDRFKICQSWEQTARLNGLEDARFCYGDSVNNYQWPNEISTGRMMTNKPCLTVNRVRIYCENIIGNAMQNQPEIRIRPVGDNASFQASQIWEGICRHIAYISDARDAYNTAVTNQVVGGIGYFRFVTDYKSDNSFDQEIYIRRVADPNSIYLDPHISKFSGEDAKFAFVFRDMDRAEFEQEYPKYKDVVNLNPLNEGRGDDYGWTTKDRVRVAEYYRVVEDTDTLHYMDNGFIAKESHAKVLQGDAVLDEPNPDALQQMRDKSIRSRDITTRKIEHFLIAGDQIIEKNIWPGKYIPIVRVVGTETVIDKRLDRAGHVRGLVSIQQSYNYYTSAGIEHVALQSKSPWLAPVAAIEGYEEDYANANTENLSVLTYNHMDDDGREIPPPQRADPPAYADGYLKGMQVATNEFDLASGVPAASLGEQSNERSGKAINARQSAGANATYFYTEHFATAIRYAGKIILDLVPHIYDVERVTKILALDGTQQTIKVDPNAQQAHQPVPALDPESIDPDHIAAIWNPTIGEFDVEADVGPDYLSRRAQAFDAISTIIAQNESYAPLLGDLWARSADFPLSDVIADRLKRMVPPQALGTGPTQEVQQLQQQLAQQHQIMQQLSQELQAAKNKMTEVNLQKDVDMYEAETKRFAAVGKIDEAALKPIVRELVSQMLGIPVNQVIAAHMVEQAQMEQAAGLSQQPQGQPQ